MKNTNKKIEGKIIEKFSKAELYEIADIIKKYEVTSDTLSDFMADRRFLPLKVNNHQTTEKIYSLTDQEYATLVRMMFDFLSF